MFWGKFGGFWGLGARTGGITFWTFYCGGLLFEDVWGIGGCWPGGNLNPAGGGGRGLFGSNLKPGGGWGILLKSVLFCVFAKFAELLILAGFWIEFAVLVIDTV